MDRAGPRRIEKSLVGPGTVVQGRAAPVRAGQGRTGPARACLGPGRTHTGLPAGSKGVRREQGKTRGNSVPGTGMAGETGGGGDRQGPSPPDPTNSISWVGPGGTQYITKMDPFYFSLAVFQQVQ